MSNPRRVVGIIAGGGTLPAEIAARASARGDAVHIIAIEGEADEAFAGFPVTRVTWGGIGTVLRTLRRAGCTELLIVGRVTRPDLRTIVPDLGFLMNLPRIVRIVRGGGDDSVLSRVIELFEGNGLRVVGPIDVAPELLVGEGTLAGAVPSAVAVSDAALGFKVIATLGKYDIGQSLVVASGKIEAIEGAEGTDAMLERVAARRRAAAAGGEAASAPYGVLVKAPKPGQELRIDLPAIGPETVTRAAAARLEGIAVEDKRVLAARRPELVALAEEHGVFVHGFAMAGTKSTPPPAQYALVQHTRLTPDDRGARDIASGAAVLDALRPVLASRAVVVVRGHVLAVEAGEGTAEVLARAAGLRQWGRGRRRARAGVTVIASADDIDPQTVEAAARAGLAGLAILGAGAGGSIAPASVEAAFAHNLFIAALEKREDGPHGR